MSLWPPPRSTRHSGKRRRGLLLAALAAVLLVGVGVGAAVWALQSRPDTSAAETSVPDSYAGTWSGEMAQVDDDGKHVTEWGVKVKLESGMERGVAEYTLNCRGSLTMVEQDGDRLVFDYVETYDRDDRCIDESELILEPGSSAEELEAQWNAVSHDGTPMTSTGTLS
ncbi:MAG: hypothetical protein M0026_06885 [Nocardiopsaceae bacterium]|nr:hypothetical protein [Nocardiopsaceae bacterium]